MPRFLLERFVGDVDREELDRIAEHSTRVREERFPEVAWEHTHVVRTEGGLTAFCVYRSDDIERVRAHAEAIGLPAERIHEIEADLEPAVPQVPSA